MIQVQYTTVFICDGTHAGPPFTASFALPPAVSKRLAAKAGWTEDGTSQLCPACSASPLPVVPLPVVLTEPALLEPVPLPGLLTEQPLTEPVRLTSQLPVVTPAVMLAEPA